MTALHAEWTKLRTVPGPLWLLLATVVATVGLGAAMPCCTTDPVKTSLTGVTLGQAVVVVLAVSVIAGEYGTGMITTTLTALPGRVKVLAAKAMVVGMVTTAAALVGVLGTVLVRDIPLTDPPALRAATGSVLYLTLVALLALGAATVIRDAAAATGVVLALLYLTPLIASLVPDPDWRERLEEVSPMTAGLAVQATTNLAAQPIAPWAGLGVLAAWAAAALVAGATSLRVRDA